MFLSSSDTHIVILSTFMLDKSLVHSHNKLVHRYLALHGTGMFDIHKHGIQQFVDVFFSRRLSH